MTIPKKITNITIAQIAVTPADFNSLQALANIHKGKAWDTTATSPLAVTEKKLVNIFKKNLKTALFTRFQGSFCCYCAVELTNHQRTYDLDHVIAKDGRSQVVFVLQNLALACGPCNTNKSFQKTTTSFGSDIDSVLISSNDYLLVHPHHDNWEDFFVVDKYRRVKSKSKVKESKALNTIKLCGINKLNAIRLAHHFDWVRSSSRRQSDWMTFYQDLYSTMDSQRKKRFGKFVATLLDSQGDPAAASLYVLLKDRIDDLLAVSP